MYILDVIISIVFGLLTGYALAKMIINSVTYVGPASKDIVKNVYKDKDGICYKLTPSIHICPISHSMTNEL